MFLHKLKERFKKPKIVTSLQVLTEKCIGCGACVTKCKREVFTLDTARHLAVVAHIEACVGCGKCVEKMCQYNAIELITEA